MKTGSQMRPWRPTVIGSPLPRGGLVWWVTMVDDEGQLVFGPTPYPTWATALRWANRLGEARNRRLR
jgi:hypothetical protein